jgi:hypothetical protein
MSLKMRQAGANVFLRAVGSTGRAKCSVPVYVAVLMSLIELEIDTHYSAAQSIIAYVECSQM